MTVSYPLRLIPVPQNWSRKLRNAPSATSSNKIIQRRVYVACENHDCRPETCEHSQHARDSIRYPRVHHSLPSSQSSRPTSLGEDQNPETSRGPVGEQDHAETCGQANRHHGKFEYRTGFRDSGCSEGGVTVGSAASLSRPSASRSIPRARPGSPGPPRSRSGVRRGCVFAFRSRRRAVSNSSPAPCQSFAEASWGLWWRGVVG